MFTEYRHCRWYDPYPKLAFALKMLFLAPDVARRRAMQGLKTFLQTQLIQHPIALPMPEKIGNRWYDDSPEMTSTLELLKETPDLLKTASADKLLDLLCA